MGRMWNILVSRNTGIILLIAVSAVLMIGAVLPNPDLLPSADADKLKNESPMLYSLGRHFNSMKIGRSPAFGVLGLLLVVSTTACSIDRIVKQVRSGRGGTAVPEIREKPPAATVQYTPAAERIVNEWLRRDRWKIAYSESSGRSMIIATRGEWGTWGSLFFHAVLITLIVGILVFVYSGFYATMLITEGQSRVLTHESLNRIDKLPLFGMTYPDLQFEFKSYAEEYFEDGSPKDHVADFTINDRENGRSISHHFRINHPLAYRGIHFLLLERGVAPEFALIRNGRTVYDASVALRLADAATDRFEILEESMEIVVQYFPDLARSPDGGVYSKSRVPRNPHFGLDISRGGVRVFRGLLKQGEQTTFGEYTLLFRANRHWVVLSLVRETGIGFIFVSAMIGLIGILARVLDPDRTIAVVLTPAPGPGTIDFHYAAKHFDGILAEYVADLAASAMSGQTGGTHVAH